jgi:DNA-binding protein YbaB
MNEQILDPGGAVERLTAWKDRIDKLAADTRAMSERLQQVRVVVADPDGLVELTIDSTGALVDLRLTDRIQRTRPDAVATAVLTTLATARQQLAERSQEIVAETVGTDSPTGQAIVAQVGRQRRDGSTAASDDEDFDDHSYLRR